MNTTTPVEKITYKNKDIWLKREDKFRFLKTDQYGGKVRTCWALCGKAKKNGQDVVTAGSRSSPQCNIVATIAKHMGLKCRIHTPSGKLGPELESAVARGAEIVQHRPGYNSVIVKRCRDDAAQSGLFEIPFGMECEEAVSQTRKQLCNVPWHSIKRILVPVGSGMSLAGILHGIVDNKKENDVHVLGVIVGANPMKRLEKFAPKNWKDFCTLVTSELPYSKSPKICKVNDVDVDPIYEAKCIPYLKDGDLFWIVGHRAQ